MSRLREITNKLLIRACVHCDEPAEAEKALKEHNMMVDDFLAQILDHLKAEALKYIWYSERDDEFYITKTDLTSILEKEKE